MHCVMSVLPIGDMALSGHKAHATKEATSLLYVPAAQSKHPALESPSKPRSHWQSLSSSDPESAADPFGQDRQAVDPPLVGWVSAGWGRVRSKRTQRTLSEPRPVLVLPRLARLALPGRPDVSSFARAVSDSRAAIEQGKRPKRTGCARLRTSGVLVRACRAVDARIPDSKRRADIARAPACARGRVWGIGALYRAGQTRTFAIRLLIRPFRASIAALALIQRAREPLVAHAPLAVVLDVNDSQRLTPGVCNDQRLAVWHELRRIRRVELRDPRVTIQVPSLPRPSQGPHCPSQHRDQSHPVIEPVRNDRKQPARCQRYIRRAPEHRDVRWSVLEPTHPLGPGPGARQSRRVAICDPHLAYHVVPLVRDDDVEPVPGHSNGARPIESNVHSLAIHPPRLVRACKRRHRPPRPRHFAEPVVALVSHDDGPIGQQLHVGRAHEPGVGSHSVCESGRGSGQGRCRAAGAADNADAVVAVVCQNDRRAIRSDHEPALRWVEPRGCCHPVCKAILLRDPGQDHFVAGLER
eukprot:1728100-Rhodomonas_salina.2